MRSRALKFWADKENKKGQVSLELMIIIGLMIIIMIPGIMYAMNTINEQKQAQASAEAQQAINRIGHTVNSVGSMGYNSAVKIEVVIPEYVIAFDAASSSGENIRRGEVYIRLMTSMGPQDLVFMTNYEVINELGQTLSPGKYNIEIISLNSTSVKIRKA